MPCSARSSSKASSRTITRWLNLLARHVAIDKPDEGIHQLAFALVAMANDYCMSREFMHMLAPRVLERPDANEQILNRLVGYSAALLRGEIERRNVPRKSASRLRADAKPRSMPLAGADAHRHDDSRHGTAIRKRVPPRAAQR